jgi:hypothetical protein
LRLAGRRGDAIVAHGIVLVDAIARTCVPMITLVVFFRLVTSPSARKDRWPDPTI